MSETRYAWYKRKAETGHWTVERMLVIAASDDEIDDLEFEALELWAKRTGGKRQPAPKTQPKQ